MKYTNLVDAKGSRNRVEVRMKFLEEGFLTKAKVVALLQVSLPTLWRWEKINILKPIRIGGRVYYRMKDIESLFVKEKGGVK